jgi:hypothetical protein
MEVIAGFFFSCLCCCNSRFFEGFFLGLVSFTNFCCMSFLTFFGLSWLFCNGFHGHIEV